MMKLTARLFKGCTLWVAAVALTTTLQAQTQDLQALVRSMTGSATYSVEGRSGIPIKPGSRLPVGSVIQTGSGSSVELFLGRGTGIVKLKENTTLGIIKLSTTDTGAELLTDTQLSLPAGDLLGSVNKLPAGSHYEIKTPDGLAGVRGTRYRIQVPGGISVLDGTLVFVNKDGKPTVVKGPGFFDPRGTEPTSRPLTPDELPPLQREFNFGTPGDLALRPTPTPPPQEQFLSPVSARR